MTRLKKTGFLVLVVALSLVAAACDSNGEAELTTTSSVVGSTTEPAPETSTSPDSNSTTSTTLAGEVVDDSEVVGRDSTAEGEVLYILIDPGEYTDVDIQNFIGDTIESDSSVDNIELFDDRDAIDAFLLPEEDRTATDLALIDSHHLATLRNGNRIIFRGPYADSGEIAIGS